MKRIVPLFLCLALALSACGGEKKEQSGKTPEELTAAYAEAITAARSQEENRDFPLITDPEDQDAELVFTVLGLTPEDLEAFAMAVSLRNVQAYCVAALKPAEGKEDTVKQGLENYIETQKSSFEFYLEDQFEVAAAAKLEQLEDGTCLLVMCPGQDEVFESVKAALEA